MEQSSVVDTGNRNTEAWNVAAKAWLIKAQGETMDPLTPAQVEQLESEDAFPLIRELVGCDWIELVKLNSRTILMPTSGLEMWVDEEGKLKLLEPNLLASALAEKPIVGNVVVTLKGVIK